MGYFLIIIIFLRLFTIQLLETTMQQNTFFENAKKLLIHVSDELENAEFNYRLAAYYYQTYQPLVAIQSANEAKAIFFKTYKL